MSVAQHSRLVAECWSEDDVDSQFPAYYFNFEKPTEPENLTGVNYDGKDDHQTIRHKFDPLFHLPCRILDDWYLRLKPNRSLSYFTIEQNVFPHRRVSLPMNTLDLDKYILGGKLKPQLSGQEPIRVELDGLDFYTIDTSKRFRGYWVVTSQARYWLRRPCCRVLEIPKLRITVDGEDVLGQDDERDAFNKGSLEAQLPSQEHLHQFHGAQLRLFCDIIDRLILSDGTYNTIIHNLSLNELNQILAPRQDAAMRTMTTKSIQRSVCRNLAQGSKFLVPHLRVFDPKVRQSRWFQELVAGCDDNQGTNIGPNQSKATGEVWVKLESSNDMDRQNETSQASESCKSLSCAEDGNNGVDNLLPKRPLAPLEPNKAVVALLSQPQKPNCPRPPIRKLEITTVGIADGTLKVAKDILFQNTLSQVTSSPKTNDNVKIMGTGSVHVQRSNPLTKKSIGAKQSSPPSRQSADSRHTLIDQGNDRRPNPSRISSALMGKPQKVLSASNRPGSKTMQARQPTHPIPPKICDKTEHAVAPAKHTATHSTISFSSANTILPTIPKKAKTTGQYPQSKTSNESTRYSLDHQHHNGASNATVPANACTFVEERQPNEISRAGSVETHLRFQDSSRLRPSPWKRQKLSRAEFGQNAAHALEGPNSHVNGRKPGAQPHQRVQHPEIVDRLQSVSGPPPIRGQAPITQGKFSVQPDKRAQHLPQGCYKYPIRPPSCSQGDTSQVPRRPEYNTNNRFADRQYHQHEAFKPQQFRHPFVRHGDFQTGSYPSPTGMGTDNKTTKYLVGDGRKRPRPRGDNRSVNNPPAWHR